MPAQNRTRTTAASAGAASTHFEKVCRQQATHAVVEAPAQAKGTPSRSRKHRRRIREAQAAAVAAEAAVYDGRLEEEKTSGQRGEGVVYPLVVSTCGEEGDVKLGVGGDNSVAEALASFGENVHQVGSGG